MWPIPATHPTTVSHSGRVTVFTKPHRRQTIIGTPSRQQLLPERFSGNLHSSRRAHQQERLPPIYLPVEASPKNTFPHADLRSGAVRHCWYMRLLQQVRLPPTSPSIHSTLPAVTGKALLLHFFSPTTVSAFFCRLNLHCFCVF